MMCVGVIRVVTTTDTKFLEQHSARIGARFPQWRVLTGCIAGYPTGIPDETTAVQAEPAVVATARSLAGQGAQALIISCTADPGLESVRQALPLPVVGAGAASAHTALALGHRIAVVSLNEQVTEAIASVLGSCLTAHIYAPGVETTHDLANPSHRAALVEQALSRSDYDVLLLGCTGLSTIGLAEELRPRKAVPVIDPIDAAASALAVWQL